MIERKFKSINCTYCNKEFVPKSSRQKACSLRHTFKCPKCNKDIPNRENRQRKKLCMECSMKQSKETLLGKYGVDNSFNIPSVREKQRRKTYTEEVNKKRRKTLLEKYGVDNYFKSNERRLKDKKHLSKYGYLPGSSPESKEKRKKTLLKKYGVDNYFKSKEFITKLSATNTKNISNFKDWINLKEYLENHPNKYTANELALYFDVSPKSVYRKARKEGVHHLLINNISNLEEVYINILNEYNIEFILHDRTIIKPLELDIYIPSLNLAIEISPTFTHNYNKYGEYPRGVNSKSYHYNKFKLCYEKEIELITIFQWTNLSSIENLLISKIKKSNKIIYGRNCEVEIKNKINKTHKDFLEENHVLGSINNYKETQVVELKYNAELIGFGIFYINKNRAELKRLVFSYSVNVTGGASKILKNFLKNNPNVEEVITFSNNELGTGNVYKTLEFELVEESKGSLLWHNTKENIVIKNLSLVKQSADRLLKNLPNYKSVKTGDKLPTNQELIKSYDFKPIYDCGYRKWIYFRK